MFSAKTLAEGYRLAKDGLLERLVNLPPPANDTWLPIVPDGQATSHLTWKRLLFLQCHVGVLGAHRNVEKTVLILRRQVWWAGLAKDVEFWCSKCVTCLRFRRMPQKQEAVAVIPTDAECWEEVMIDLEGPSQPMDMDGNKYAMTYICCVCRGILLNRSRH